MLDIKFIRKNKELIENSLVERGIKNIELNYLFSLDDKRKELLIKLDDLRKKKRIMTQSIENAVISDKKPNYKSIKEIKSLNISIRRYEKEIVSLEHKINELLKNLPNIPHPTVPKGLPGRPNKLVRKWGKIPKFNFSPQTYLEIGQKLGIIDFSESFSTLGFDVIFYKGLGARLQRALINFLMDSHMNKNYYELFPPVIMEGNPVLKMLQGKAFDSRELPLCFFIYSLCFRKDWDFAQDIKNDLKRIRQFDSIELIKITTPKSSYEVLENTVKEAEEILKLLELPYEVYLFTKGNLDYIANKAYSIKVFLPGLDTFLEISICSNLTDFFPKDMNIRYKMVGTGEKRYVHIVTATNLIIPRAMIAILENFQQFDGSFAIPKVLRPYLSGLDKISL